MKLVYGEAVSLTNVVPSRRCQQFLFPRVLGQDLISRLHTIKWFKLISAFTSR